MYVDPSNVVSGTAGAAAASIVKPDDPRKRPGQVAESRLGEAYARVLHRALQMEGSQAEAAVKQLKDSVEAGHYDTMESAIQAAQTIVKYGI